MFSFKRTFARRLTLKIILILFVLMSGTMYLIYDISKDVMTQETRLHYEEILRNTNMDVSNMLTEVSVAVINNDQGKCSLEFPAGERMKDAIAAFEKGIEVLNAQREASAK